MKSVKQEESLEASAAAQRLHQLVETCQDAVLFIDRFGNIVLANPAAYRIFGYAAPELEGRDVRILMAEPYASQHQGYVDRYESTGEKRAIGRIRQVVALRRGGQEFPIELSVTQLAEEGDGARYGAFIRDVSDKTRLQGELMERERVATVGTTASMLVHEVGNPLNNMALQLQSLRRKVSRHTGTESTIENVDTCLAEIQRLSRLVQEFRALSGRRRIVKRWTNMVRLIESALASMTPFGAEVSLVRRFESEEVDIMVDPDKLQQVLINLYHNAVEAMPGGGILTIAASRLGEEYLVEVSDTGQGIEPGVDVFEPFVTTKPDGTGLGLAICSEIIREHGGTLNYQTVVGEGTIFRIRLPAVSARDSSRHEAGLEGEIRKV